MLRYKVEPCDILSPIIGQRVQVDAQCFVFITPESLANPVIINLSNLDNEVDDILAMCCKLDSLWRDASLETCQKLQNQLFPNGILWDKEKDNYRTFDENEALSIIARLSVNYKNKKEENSFEISSFVQSCA